MGTQISGAEWEIMQYLWQHPQENTFAAILNTYLMRLIKRGLMRLVEDKKPQKDAENRNGGGTMR